MRSTPISIEWEDGPESPSEPWPNCGCQGNPGLRPSPPRPSERQLGLEYMQDPRLCLHSDTSTAPEGHPHCWDCGADLCPMCGIELNYGEGSVCDRCDDERQYDD